MTDTNIMEMLQRAAVLCEEGGKIYHSCDNTTARQRRADARQLRELAVRWKAATKRAGKGGEVTLAIRVGPVRRPPMMIVGDL